MSEKAQPNRWRCLSTGCNPVLNEATAATHTRETGHRTAKWPVRSKEGQRRARVRNRTGYYDKYNVGEKSYAARGLGGFGAHDNMMGGDRGTGDFQLTGEDFSIDEMSDNDWGVR